jgi:predicted transglutaminase-like protease
MNVNDYAEQVVNRFITDITDHVFLSIEHDEELMREYMTNVNRYNLEPVNMAIGKKVMEILNLANLDENDTPKSRLIKSYTRHKIK